MSDKIKVGIIMGSQSDWPTLRKAAIDAARTDDPKRRNAKSPTLPELHEVRGSVALQVACSFEHLACTQT